jgi:D-alanyl-D-alanine endopeptidase (penicillin-binding protein 7)
MRAIILCLVLVFSSNICLARKSPTVQPEAYAIWNVDTGHLLNSKNTDLVRPQASITKLMTVLVILNLNLDLDERVTVVGVEGSRKIRRGDRITRHELIDLALVASDNLASRTLSETAGISYDEFISKMNDTAVSLGMNETKYADSTGLLALNVSTASDIKLLVQETENHFIFKQNAMKPTVKVDVTFKNKFRQVTVNNTNRFAGQLDIIGAKTGYTTPAGRCLTMFFETNGQRYIVVVMGARSSEHRHKMVSKLIDTVIK